MFRNLLIVILLGSVLDAQAAKMDFEIARQGFETKDIQELARQAFANPETFAHSLAIDLGGQRLIGWPGTWMLPLSALDLIGYYFSLEKAQYYASAGKWTPPKHRQKTAHVEYYQRVINPRNAPYSWGLSHGSTYEFARVFLQELLALNSDIGLQTIKILAQTGREFWLLQIVWHVFPSQLADDRFVKELVESFELEPDYTGSVSEPYRNIAEGIIRRGKENPGSNVRHLLATLYGRAQLRGENAQFNFESLQLRTDGLDCAVILEVDSVYKMKNGSLLR